MHQQIKKRMIRLKYCILCLGLFLCGACSDSSEEGYDTGSAQQIYNDLRGTYQGTVTVNNLPATIQIVIGTDFTVKNLPTEPILARIFNGSDLEAAVASMEKVNFTAETDQMAIVDSYFMLTMMPGDLMFTVKVGENSYPVTVTFQTRAWRSHLYDDLSMSLFASELYCDGVSYDLSQNGISYVVDNAKKQ